MSQSGFAADFLWGASTSAYQVEGGADADGRGPSVWDMYSSVPNTVYNGDTGQVACDHYHRYQSDVALMAHMGLKAYRFSVSWSRVLPEGKGKVNPAGLDFYSRLVDALLEKNIRPFVTLYHWDYPLALYHQGGWLNRDSADWMADYGQIVAEKLADRVKDWMTWNEPSIFCMAGHSEGGLAPGLRLKRPDVLRVAHHILLAHGKTVQRLRSVANDLRIGIAATGPIGLPVSDADIEAARRYTFSDDEPNLWKHNSWADPAILGHYSPEFSTVEALMPPHYQDDLPTIHQKLDFYGLNTYSGDHIRTHEGRPQIVKGATGHAVTLFHWPVTPSVLYWGTRFLHERYQLPIYITENGLSNPDWVHSDGKVHDPQRIDHLTTHLRELRKAIREGVDVRGYMHWALLDNMEWGDGMKQRFGLIHVDYQTLQRTLKDSAYWYRDLIASQGALLD